VVISFGQLLKIKKSENWKSCPNLGPLLCNGKSYAIIVTKHELGYIMGDFFRNSSGHPAACAEKGLLFRQFRLHEAKIAVKVRLY
jgi:hypothetical protein